jgi:hypothetical protein
LEHFLLVLVVLPGQLIIQQAVVMALTVSKLSLAYNISMVALVGLVVDLRVLVLLLTPAATVVPEHLAVVVEAADLALLVTVKVKVGVAATELLSLLLGN